MSDRENTRRCQAVLTTDKHGKIGTPCKQWAQHDSPYCNRHQGGDGAGTPRDLERMERTVGRCVARSSRTGQQCKRQSLRGMRVCKFHGGGAVASRGKAQEMLDRMVEPVLWELRDIALNPDSSKSERLRAIQIVLDRTLPKEVKHEVEVKPWEITMQQIIADNGAPSLNRQPSPEQVAELESYMPEDHRVDDYEDDIEEAEIVEEDPRDELWQIRPADGAQSRATAEPPRRPVNVNNDPLWMTRRRNEDD